MLRVTDLFVMLGGHLLVMLSLRYSSDRPKLSNTIKYNSKLLFQLHKLSPQSGCSSHWLKASLLFGDVTLHFSILHKYQTIKTFVFAQYGSRKAYHAVVGMKTFILTGGTQIKVWTLDALVAKTFHSCQACITCHTIMFLVLTCETVLLQNMYS